RPLSARQWQIGQAVEIQWQDQWYAGTILEKRGTEYYVHYQGYDDSWNEWVATERLRSPDDSDPAPASDTSDTNTDPNPTATKDIAALVKALESKHNVEINYQRKVADVWQKSSYQLPADSAQLRRYLIMLQREMAKYPYGYFQKSKCGSFVLVTGYRFDNHERAAMPDPYSGHLFYSIDGAYGDDSDEYLVHVFHHELNHCTEYAIWQDQYYKWTAWAALNPAGFQYGKGGLAAYSESEDQYSLVHPKPGFVNRYATSGQEEDRSEIIAVLLTDSQHARLHEICRQDNYLRRKVRKLAGLLHQFAGRSFIDQETHSACFAN
ncbi:MAG: hypothetical protein KDK39_14405, partial [Leptospiraceae bacterium]|nr:hypothetical protein [Leptospiraceae bacterium]